MLHAIAVLGSELFGFVALLFDAGQLRLERFDGGAGFVLGLRLPLHLRGHKLGLGIGSELGDQFLVALFFPGLGGFFFLLHVLAQAGFQLPQAGVPARLPPANGPLGLALGFGVRLRGAQLVVGLLLRVLKANRGLGLQLFFALFESELRGVFTLLDFLAPARVHLAGALLDLALDLGLAEAGVLLDHALFLSEAGLIRQGQFLLALFQAMLGALVVLAQRLFKFQLLPFETVFLLARNLLDLTGGGFLGL